MFDLCGGARLAVPAISASSLVENAVKHGVEPKPGVTHDAREAQVVKALSPGNSRCESRTTAWA